VSDCIGWEIGETQVEGKIPELQLANLRRSRVGKIKHSVCIKCHKPIGRHNAGRIKTRVADGSNGQGVFRDICLACSQK